MRILESLKLKIIAEEHLREYAGSDEIIVSDIVIEDNEMISATYFKPDNGTFIKSMKHLGLVKSYAIRNYVESYMQRVSNDDEIVVEHVKITGDDEIKVIYTYRDNFDEVNRSASYILGRIFENTK